jgi:hypothetical protein
VKFSSAKGRKSQDYRKIRVFQLIYTVSVLYVKVMVGTVLPHAGDWLLHLKASSVISFFDRNSELVVFKSSGT